MLKQDVDCDSEASSPGHRGYFPGQGLALRTDDTKRCRIITSVGKQMETAEKFCGDKTERITRSLPLHVKLWEYAKIPYIYNSSHG